MIDVALFVGSRYPVDRKKIRQRVAEFLAKKGIQEAQLSVSIVGVRRMTWLNENLMKHEGCTDVLTFPQFDPEQPDKKFPSISEGEKSFHHLGDIVVCFPEAVTQARKLGRMVDDQICFYVEHGLLHLLGIHHD